MLYSRLNKRKLWSCLLHVSLSHLYVLCSRCMNFVAFYVIIFLLHIITLYKSVWKSSNVVKSVCAEVTSHICLKPEKNSNLLPNNMCSKSENRQPQKEKCVHNLRRHNVFAASDGTVCLQPQNVD